LPQTDESPSVTQAAIGRRVSDFWLDETPNLLHPTEKRLLDCVRRGAVCDMDTDRPSQPSSDNRVRAAFLRFLCLGGDESTPVHEHGVLLRGVYIEGDLDLFGAVAPRNISLIHCQLAGNLVLTDCSLRTLVMSGSTIRGLQGDRCQSTGSIKLDDGFVAEDMVRMAGARIAGDLNCRGGQFLAGERALVVAKARIEGDGFFDRGFVAQGTVDLSGCSISGALSCVEGQFLCSDQALFAPRLSVGHNIKLGAGCRTNGQVSFQGASAGGDMIFTGGEFNPSDDPEKALETTCINLRGATIAGTLFWRQITVANGKLDLAGARCLTLNMDWESWEMPSEIRLDNFSYSGFNQLDETTSTRFWINWIERQPERHLTRNFRPKPYQQLADVLQSMGHEQEAIAIRIQRKRRQADYARKHEKRSGTLLSHAFRILTGFWNRVQDFTVGYGYRPGNAVLYLLTISVIGAVIYQVAAHRGIMAPTHPLIYKEAVWDGKSGPLEPPEIPASCHQNWVYPAGKGSDLCTRSIPSEYSTFNALIYSIDIALPVVNFRMQEDWSPRVVDWKTGKHDWAGWWVRVWEWGQIGLGWTFSLLFVSALGGIIRRD